MSHGFVYVPLQAVVDRRVFVNLARLPSIGMTVRHVKKMFDGNFCLYNHFYRSPVGRGMLRAGSKRHYPIQTKVEDSGDRENAGRN